MSDKNKSELKIYTKKGDKGETSLLGGTRVPKHHIRIEAYGTVDELNSYIGIIRDSIEDIKTKTILLEIQDRLFTAESLLAYDGSKEIKLPQLHEDDIFLLEKEIDKMNENLPELTNFIIPGGHILSSHCHVARCVCRRAERIIIKLSEIEKVDDINIKYFNRLSDYLFVLSRKILKDFGAEETIWKSRF
jgi:cob(I)alamin adenosyltransferase